MTRTVLLRGAIAALVLAYGPPTGAQEGPRREAAKRPILLVGGNSYAPLSYVEDGEIKGIKVDIAAEISVVLGREVRIELTDWESARDRVQRGEADGLLTLAPTAERRLLYDFSEPTMTHEWGVFVRRGETAAWDIADLDGKTLGVTAESLPRTFLRQAAPNADIVTVETLDAGFAKLAAGTIDAIAADLWVGAYTIERLGFTNIVRSGVPFATSTSAIAVSKGNQALVDDLNRAIRILKANGTIARILTRWRPKEMVFLSRGRMTSMLALVAAVLLVLVLFGGVVLWKQIRAQARRREAEERLQLLAQALQSASDCISITDIEDRIVYVNEAFLRTYEYDERDLIGRHINMVRAADDTLEKIRTIFDATREGGWQGTIRNRSKSGRVFPVSLATSMVKDEVGRVVGAVGVARDRTQEEAAAEALRTSEEKYRQVVENAHDIIFTVDREGYCTSMNRAGQEISGFLANTPRGVHMAHLIVSEHADTAVRHLECVLNGEAVPRFEIDIMTRQGRRLTLELDVHAIQIEDRIVGAQGIARDVTARKELEAQLRQAQKMEAVGRLAGGVAHDFNNILTVVMGCADLAAAQIDEASPIRTDIQEIQRAAESAASLTRQLLIFSRKSIVQPAVLDLNQIVKRLNQMLRRLVGEDIEFSVNARADAGHLKADAGQIEQIVLNLVVNARDAMPGGGTLTVETGSIRLDEAFSRTHAVAPGEFVTLSVTDTGTGMTPDVQARIFEPFFTTKDPTKGTGLGLATVHAIVQQSGGCILVDSAPHKGTTFTIYLPRVAAPGAGAAPFAPVANTTETLGTVLLVEDDDGIRALGARALRERGYEVLTACHAAEAEAVFEHPLHPVDLLLTDIVMPGVNGRVLAERLRQRNPDLKVLYTSGYTDDTVALRNVQHDNAAFLQKPYGPAALVREVHRLLVADEVAA